MKYNEEKQKVTIKVDLPHIQIISIKIFGDTPLIQQKWTEKAKNEIRQKQAGIRILKRPVRNPDQEYKDSYYVNKEGHVAFPASAIKNAVIAVAQRKGFVGRFDGPLMKGSFFIQADEENLLEVQYEEMRMREDNVILGGPSRPADLRYRAEFLNWSIAFKVELDPEILTPETFINILAHAGFSNGLGEWRIEKGGQFGKFHVEGIEIK